MSDPDLSQILADLAAGTIDAAEAARRIEAAQKKQAPADAEPEVDEPAGPTGVKGTERVTIRAVGRRVTVVGDASVATASVTGEHVLRRQGDVLEISADGEEAVLAVTDTGIGMTAEETARLFRDFVRIKNDQTRRIMGSGLGLSIVKKLALLYGGDATVWSEPGEGSTFTVRLKRNLGGEPAAAAERAVEA